MMPFTELDINKLYRLISPHVDQVTCIECCQYYLVPSTAPCGHTLCHGCWAGRKKCATCGSAVNRKSLKLNLQLQIITEHTKGLKEEFENIFKVDFDEFSLENPIEKEVTKDPTRNVRDWLANSDNQFSAPDASQPYSTHDFNNQPKEIGNKAQIHSETSRTNSTKNIIHVSIPQDDWDKIEEMPETEVKTKKKENAIGPMDIEPFVLDPFEFTTDNPRRSSRNKDNVLVNSVDQTSAKSSSKDTKASNQNWANVKRMRKEFSKLNKKSKNKLNVSIEMCKKTLIQSNKNTPLLTGNKSQESAFNIDDNTPDIVNPKECVKVPKDMKNDNFSNNNQYKDLEIPNEIIEMECETHLNENIKCIDSQKVENAQPCNTTNNNQLQTPNDQVQPVTFIMKGGFQAPCIEENNESCDNNNPQTITVNTDNVGQTTNSDDIEITIKLGNTHICIKKKEKDVKFRVTADREIQTSLEKCVQNNINVASSSSKNILEPKNNVIINVQNNEYNTQQVQKCVSDNKVLSNNKTPLSKKNTESADTVTAQYEITESIEKELSKEMEKPSVKKNIQSNLINKKTDINKSVPDDDMLDEDCLNDIDLFDNDSVKEGHVQSLKSTNHAPSEIFISTLKSNKSKKQIDKRPRDAKPDDLPISKKMKLNNENVDTSKSIQSKSLDPDSDLNTYDLVMGKVFASIDVDLASKNDEGNVKNSQFVDKEYEKSITPHTKTKPNLCDSIHGQSENVFSLLEKENDTLIQIQSAKTQTRIENQKAPVESQDHIEIMDEDLCTPVQDKDNNVHSDESIVEETPQKSASFQKAKQKSGGSLNTENVVKNKSLRLKRTETELGNAQKSSNTPNIMSVIDLSDVAEESTRKTKHVTVLEVSKSRAHLETPLTISNFVDQIKHKSTPMAKKSLNFDHENTEISDIDPEQTICPSSFIAAKTTQEKEFLSKAFEESPVTRAKSPLAMRSPRMKAKKYCLAGSCLSASEISDVKILCSLQKWDYVDKFTMDLTHLVVGVDEENKSQRSVKYMCALAASKWIVSYDWVQTCLLMKKVVNEEPFEALDNTGEPGPRRSRLARQKLFEGITFFCMPPFSLLDVDTLKGMLEAAGGVVVDEPSKVRVTSDSVALLLAEPEHTMENKFIYLAMELSIVPVNSEWALNCLGSYTIGSVLELLLCPETLLPPATAHWPPELMAKDFD